MSRGLVQIHSLAVSGIQLGDRRCVFFSPYDVSCVLEKKDSLECCGYVREDAGRIGLNVVLYFIQK